MRHLMAIALGALLVSCGGAATLPSTSPQPFRRQLGFMFMEAPRGIPTIAHEADAPAHELMHCWTGLADDALGPDEHTIQLRLRFNAGSIAVDLTHQKTERTAALSACVREVLAGHEWPVEKKEITGSVPLIFGVQNDPPPSALPDR